MIILYLISDIHGNYSDFQQILKKIAFDKEKDNLIIMGDVIDRGPDGIKLIEYIKPFLENNSIELLLGNHELFAIYYLKGLLDERTWIAFGGEDTVKEVKQMSALEKNRLLSFFGKSTVLFGNQFKVLWRYSCYPYWH